MKKKEDVFITKSFQETQALGEKFAKDLKGGDMLALYGDLGSGKTTFAQGLAEGLGIEKRIISPTFIIVRSYKLRAGSFYHIDLYRIEREKDIEGLGIEEIMNDPKSIVTIEWAEKLGNGLPKKRIDIKFEYVDEDKRRITIAKLT